MKRESALLLALLMFTSLAHAVGLGEIKIHSSLNQVLSAEVDVLSAKDVLVEDISASLASDEIFVQSGIEKFEYLSALRFEVIKLGSGEKRIKITTEKPVDEPFLDFLLVLSWPQGQMVREYTALLNPPTYVVEKPVPPKLDLVEDAPIDIETPLAEVVTAPETKPVKSISKPAVKSPGTQAKSATYGVRSNDTVFSMAKKFAESYDGRYQPDQIMAAIFDKNKSAFMRGNANLLKKGAKITIPTEEEVADYGAGEARQKMIAHHQQWTNWRKAKESQSVAVVDATDKSEDSLPVKEKKQSGGHLRLVAPEEEAAELEGLASTEQQLSDSAGSGKDEGTTGADTSTTGMQSPESQSALSLSMGKITPEAKEMMERLKQTYGENIGPDLVRLVSLVNPELMALETLATGEGSEVSLTDVISKANETYASQDITTETAANANNTESSSVEPEDSAGEAVESVSPLAESESQTGQMQIPSLPDASQGAVGGLPSEQAIETSQDDGKNAGAQAKPKPTEFTSPLDDLYSKIQNLYQDQQIRMLTGGGLLLALLLVWLMILRVRGNNKAYALKNPIRDMPVAYSEDDELDNFTAYHENDDEEERAEETDQELSQAEESGTHEDDILPTEIEPALDDVGIEASSDEDKSLYDPFEGEVPQSHAVEEINEGLSIENQKESLDDVLNDAFSPMGQNQDRTSVSTANDVITAVNAMITVGRTQEAKAKLQEGAQRFPDNDDIKLRLLQAHADEEDHLAFLEVVSDLKGKGISDELKFRIKVIHTLTWPDREFEGVTPDSPGGEQASDEEIVNESRSTPSLSSVPDNERKSVASEAGEKFNISEDFVLPGKEEPAPAFNLNELGSEGGASVGLTDDKLQSDFDLGAQTSNDQTNEIDLSHEFDLEDFTKDITRDLESALYQSYGIESPNVIDIDDNEPADENDAKLDLARAYFDIGDKQGAREIIDAVLKEGSDLQKAQANELLEKYQQ